MTGHSQFLSFAHARPGWDLRLEDPVEVLEAFCPAEVSALLAQVEQASRDGLWAAVALAYEAAPAFDPAFKVHPPDGFPLAWAALHRRPAAGPHPRGPESDGPLASPNWRPLITQGDYDAGFERIRELIRTGETYQINYTFPLEADPAGDGRAWFDRLGPGMGAPWSAWLDMGRFKVLSFSPELFFQCDGQTITARPMKGTLPRGRWPGEDAALADRLRSCPKNRAENVMIVDLLRSDLGRIARPGTVRVPTLFEVERYGTVLQMTSTVRAELLPGTGLAAILGALFPCGSVTGAPKVRSMEIIRDLEPHPRGLYTGAIGYLAPDGSCAFNVAIRTVVLDTLGGRARFGTGSGVTHDSDQGGEYGECLLKTRFLTSPPEDFRLLETLLLDRGRFFLTDGHLRRLAASADHLGFRLDEAAVRAALRDAAGSRPAGRFKVRLLLARDGTLEIQPAPLDTMTRGIVRIGWAAGPVRSDDRLLFHKTDRRALYDLALASAPGCSDAILYNELGQVTESTRANVVVELDGKLWTPTLESGLLAGVFRDELLARGIVAERVVTREELTRAERIWLVNSVRKWMRASFAGEAKDAA